MAGLVDMLASELQTVYMPTALPIGNSSSTPIGKSSDTDMPHTLSNAMSSQVATRHSLSTAPYSALPDRLAEITIDVAEEALRAKAYSDSGASMLE